MRWTKEQIQVMEIHFADALKVGGRPDASLINIVLEKDLFKGRQIANIRAWVQHANKSKRYLENQ